MDITPKEFEVRTFAQEYGGVAFTVSGHVVFFANYKDQRLYKQSTPSVLWVSIASINFHHPMPYFSKQCYDKLFDLWNGI